MRARTRLSAAALDAGSFFALDRRPLTGDPLECDGWREDYFASTNG